MTNPTYFSKRFLLLFAFFSFFIIKIKAQDYELIKTFQGHNAPVSYVTFRSEDNFLVSGDEAGKIIFWNTENGKIVKTLNIHTDKVTHLEFSNEGQFLASASYDGTVKVYDLKREKISQIFKNTSTEAYNGVKGNEPTFCTFSPDDKAVYFGGYNLQVLKGDLRKGSIEGVYRNDEFGITCGTITPNKRSLAFAAGGNIFFMDLATNRIVKALHKSEEYDDFICELAFMPRTSRLAAWAVNGQLHFWDWRTDALSYSLAATPQEGSSDMAFSEDGKLLVTGNFGGTTKLWNTSDNKILQLLDKHTSEVVTFAFSKDAKFIVTGSQDHTVRLWSKPSEKQIISKKIPKKIDNRKVEVQRTVTVRSSLVEIHFWDNYQIDGDTISVNVNGNWLLKNYGLDAEPKVLKVEFTAKDNYLIIHAHNLGSIPPNTIAVSVVEGEEEQFFTLKSDMGVSAAIHVKLE